MTHTPANEPPIDTTRAHYMEQQALAIALDKAHTPECVLKAHARSHFAYALVSARLLLARYPSDMADAARAMQRFEEAFANAWVDAIDDANFKPELRQSQREALRTLRTSTQPMFLVTQPAKHLARQSAVLHLDDLDAHALGKAWNKLDELAQELGVEPLSTFIALPGEDDTAGVPPHHMLPTLNALIDALQGQGQKFPAKRAVKLVLTQIRAVLLQLGEQGGRAYFEVDL